MVVGLLALTGYLIFGGSPTVKQVAGAERVRPAAGGRPRRAAGGEPAGHDPAGDLERRREGPGRRHGPAGEHRGRRTHHRHAAGRQRPGPGRRPAADRQDGRGGRPAAHRARARPRRADRAEHVRRDPGRQDPLLDARRRARTCAAGTAVAVVIGKQQTTVAVPNVVGQDADDARKELEDAGFTVKTHERRRGQRRRGREHGPGRGHPGAAEEHGHPAGVQRRQQQDRHAGRPGSPDRPGAGDTGRTGLLQHPGAAREHGPRERERPGARPVAVGGQEHVDGRSDHARRRAVLGGGSSTPSEGSGGN